MEVTLLQWNIWYGEKIENIAKFLKHHPTDIVCLQELSLNLDSQSQKNTPEYIAKALGYENFYRKKLPIETTGGHTIHMANGIFSKFKMLNKDFVWINEPRNDGGYDDEYRAYVEVELNIGRKKLCIGTVHMSYTHKFEMTERKRRETDILVSHLKTKKHNYIIAGDFNAVPGSYTINEISKVLKNAGPDFSEKTWTTKPFSYNGFEEDKLNWRLDYIFATKDITVESTKILDSPYSDHLPILTSLSF